MSEITDFLQYPKFILFDVFIVFELPGFSISMSPPKQSAL